VELTRQDVADDVLANSMQPGVGPVEHRICIVVRFSLEAISSIVKRKTLEVMAHDMLSNMSPEKPVTTRVVSRSIIRDRRPDKWEDSTAAVYDMRGASPTQSPRHSLVSLLVSILAIADATGSTSERPGCQGDTMEICCPTSSELCLPGPESLQ
jgi:hypothetical protein